MVKKYDPALVVPPPVSSSDEEMSDSEKEVSDTENDVSDSDSENKRDDVDSENDVVEMEDSEDEQPIGLLKKSTTGESSTKAPAAGSSSSEAPAAGSSSSEAPAAESNAETESDMDMHSVSSPDSDGFTVRQIVVKPEKQEEAAETSRRRRGKQPARARPSGSEVEKRRKRKLDVIEGPDRSEANGGNPAGKPEKRRMFQRLWSEEDEIALLKGLGEYERRNGKNPFYEMERFSEFIKKSIKISVTVRQLVDKARRMRRKFAKNVSRGKDGKDPTFKRPHDRRIFEVSKTVWGEGKLKVMPYKRGRPFGTGNRAAFSGKREATNKEKAPQKTRKKKKGSGGGGNGNGGGGVGEDFWNRYPSVRDSVNIFPYLLEWGRNFMMERLIHTPEEKLEELEGKWKELRQAVSELHVRHLQLLRETVASPDERTPNRK